MVTPGTPEETQAEMELPVDYNVDEELAAIEAAEDPTAQVVAEPDFEPLLDAEDVTDTPEAPPVEVDSPEPELPTDPAPPPLHFPLKLRLLVQRKLHRRCSSSWPGTNNSINRCSSRSTRRKLLRLKLNTVNAWKKRATCLTRPGSWLQRQGNKRSINNSSNSNTSNSFR